MSWFNIDVWWILNKISPLAAAPGLDESFLPHYRQIRWKQSWGWIPYSGGACRVSAALASNFLLSLFFSLIKRFLRVAAQKILGSEISTSLYGLSESHECIARTQYWTGNMEGADYFPVATRDTVPIDHSIKINTLRSADRVTQNWNVIPMKPYCCTFFLIVLFLIFRKITSRK